MSAFGVDFGTAAGLDLGLNYGQFGIDTGPTAPAPVATGGGLLGDIATIAESGADIYRTIKGLPPRFNQPTVRTAADKFGEFLAQREVERRVKEAEGTANEETKDQEKRDQALADRIRMVFENPEILKDLTTSAYMGSIDPASLGVSMDVTPPTPWKPSLPKGLFK